MSQPTETAVEARIAAHLVEAGAVDEAALARARQHPRYGDEGLVSALDALGLAREQEVLDWVAAEAGVERIDLAAEPLDWALAEAASFELCWRHQAVPARLAGKDVVVAMVDPMNLEAVDDLRFRLGARVRPAVASGLAVRSALARLFPDEAARALAADDAVLLRARAGGLEPPSEGGADAEAALRGRFDAWMAAGGRGEHALPLEYEAAVRLVAEVLQTALVEGSSHVRLDIPADGQSLSVRSRGAGRWRPAVALPAALGTWVLWHVKTLCRLPPGEVRGRVVVPLLVAGNDGAPQGFRVFVSAEPADTRILFARVRSSLLSTLTSWEWAAEGPADAVLAPWWAHFSAGRALLHGQDAPQAEAALVAAAEAGEAAGVVGRAPLGETLLLLSRAVEGQGRLEDAQALGERAVSVLEAAVDPSAAPLVASLVLLGELSLRQGRFDDGVALLRNALTRVETSFGAEQDIQVAWLLRRVAHGLAAQGLEAEAADCEAEAESLEAVLLS